jgi:flagellin
MNEGTASLQRSFERLSSGMRINRASDDAAGLAISTTLDAAGRVFNQGLRNANDGISLLNVAQGGAEQLSGILTRMKELATSAANGTLALAQRKSLDTEAFELQKEFNRITQATSFNGRTLLSGGFGRLNIQAGFGTGGTLGFDLGSSVSRAVGTSSVGSLINIGMTALSGAPVSSADFNGDGRDDLLLALDYSGGQPQIQVLLSNGNGTFKAGFGIVNSATDAKAADINGDGKMDIVSNTGLIILGNGDGSFKTQLINTFGNSEYIQIGDVNSDGNLDVVGSGDLQSHVYLGNGNGTFKTALSFTTTGNGAGALGDVNGDGKIDIVKPQRDYGAATEIFLGAGDGRFTSAGNVNLSTTFYTKLGDFNHDGYADIVSDAGTIALGNGNGTFKAGVSLNPGMYSFVFDDFNNDGNLDIKGTDGGVTYTHLGNGDGTFATSQQSFTGDDLASGDFNGDGVKDVALFDGSGTYTRLANTEISSAFERLDLLSAASARTALTTIETAMLRVSKELSGIGASQSRLDIATNILSQTALNYQSARSRIVDADIADESAKLTAKQILQQAGAAVLAQANQIPALALSLLRG